MGIVILDLDDTVSDASHRKHHVEVKSGKPDFGKFTQKAYLDSPNMDVILKVRHLSKDGHDIVIMSGRSATVRDQTIQWLRKNNVPYQKLLMRPASSRASSVDLKRNWLRDIDTEEVVAAIDDNDRNLSMFKTHGIPTYKVRDGKIEGSLIPNKYLSRSLEKVAVSIGGAYVRCT